MRGEKRKKVRKKKVKKKKKEKEKKHNAFATLKSVWTSGPK